jgi:hypothetical protein
MENIFEVNKALRSTVLALLRDGLSGNDAITKSG